jgi:hypothetical protein
MRRTNTKPVRKIARTKGKAKASVTGPPLKFRRSRPEPLDSNDKGSRLAYTRFIAFRARADLAGGSMTSTG